MSLRDYLFYEEPGITLYCGDCREILPLIEQSVDLVLTDPPYGIGTATNNARFSGGSQTILRTSVGRRDPIIDDDKPFDPTFLLHYRRLVLFGANNFAAKLPPSNGWIVWDKRVGLENMTGWPLGEGELAWTNVTGAVRFFRNRWMGLVRNSERGEFFHPTQKPTALMAWIVTQFTAPGSLVLDPFAGAGSTLLAGKETSRLAIGIEIDPRYCEIMVKRLRQEVLPLTPPPEGL